MAAPQITAAGTITDATGVLVRVRGRGKPKVVRAGRSATFRR